MLSSMAGETIMSITYGIEVLPEDDPYIKGAEEAIEPPITSTIPGTFLVDISYSQCGARLDSFFQFQALG